MKVSAAYRRLAARCHALADQPDNQEWLMGFLAGQAEAYKRISETLEDKGE